MMNIMLLVPLFLLFALQSYKISATSDLWNYDYLFQEVEELIDNFDTYQLPLNNDEYFVNYSTSTAPIDFGTFDFIIVGGGTAGGVLANRLTEGKFSVLVIEAGLSAPDASAILGIAGYLLYSPWNWGYNTTSQKYACLASIDQQCQFHRGKGLGGSSTINAAMYVRGNPLDYDKWSEFGVNGWSYEEVLPYFKKSEYANFTRPIDADYHGHHGLQSVTVIDDVPGLSKTIANGFREIGVPEGDYNGENQLRYDRIQTYSTYNIRSSSNYSFIWPAIRRDNLKITLNSLATKLLIEKNWVYGVQFVQNGQLYTANASKEVILSCGSINTPQLLMLSGIGPADELRKHDIEIVADLPVGKNLIDHVEFDLIRYRTDHVHYNYTLETQFDLWTQNKRPLTAAYGNHLISFFDLDNDTIPDYEFYTVPANTLYGPLINRATPLYMTGFEDYNSLTDFVIVVLLLHPASSGEVTLASSDPKDYPLINPNYLSEESDIEVIYQGIQTAIKLNNTAAYQNYTARLDIIPVPGCDDSYERMSKDWWYCAIRLFSATVFHPIGTTRMGRDRTNSVVDENLKVHGIRGLRVVDAGVLPSHISGHTNAAVVMIAEKAADLIKKKYSKN